MIRIVVTALLLLVCLSFSSCGLIITGILIADLIEDLKPEVTYQQYYCRIDVNGNSNLLQKPLEGVLSYPNTQIHWLQNGKVLLYRDYLWEGDPSFDNFRPISGFISPSYVSDKPYLTIDGNGILYSKQGSIYKFDLVNKTEENLTPNLDYAVHSPMLSADGNYLTMIRSLTALYGTGYPVVQNLVTQELISLDAASTYGSEAIYIPRFATVYYVPYFNSNNYQSMPALYKINIDNTGNQELYPLNWFYHLAIGLSYDERFITVFKQQQGYYNNGTFFCRDNQTMNWKELVGTGCSAMSRAANVLYYTKDKSIYRLELETGITQRLVSGKFKGKRIKGFSSLSPSWDGNDLIFVAELSE